MIKAFFTFLLSLCILLIGGYGQLHAHTHDDAMGCAPLTNLERSAQASFFTLLHSQSVVKSTSSIFKKDKFKLEATEICEEDEWLSLEKHVESKSIYDFNALFYGQRSGYLLHSVNKGLPFGKHSFYCFAYRLHLIFRVFRI